jgi:hypothetical protein
MSRGLSCSHSGDGHINQSGNLAAAMVSQGAHAAATSHTAEYMQRWCVAPAGFRDLRDRATGWLRTTRDSAIMGPPITGPGAVSCAGRVALRVRLLLPSLRACPSLFGEGELRALHVGDADVFRIFLLMLAADAELMWNSHLTRAVESLRVVEVVGPHMVSEAQGRSTTAPIE